MFDGIKEAYRHGMIRHRINARLRRLGLHINVYYLIRERLPQNEFEWHDLAAKYPSAVLLPEELSEISTWRNWATEEVLRKRLENGHLCVVIKHDEKIAGHTWADFDEVNDEACDYELKPGEAYLYDAYIAPEFRGHGLAPYMRIECYKHLHRAGRHTYYSVSDYFSKPAIRFKQKLDAEFMRLYLQIKIGNRELGQWLLKSYS